MEDKDLEIKILMCYTKLRDSDYKIIKEMEKYVKTHTEEEELKKSIEEREKARKFIEDNRDK